MDSTGLKGKTAVRERSTVGETTVVVKRAVVGESPTVGVASIAFSLFLTVTSRGLLIKPDEATVGLFSSSISHSRDATASFALPSNERNV